MNTPTKLSVNQKGLAPVLIVLLIAALVGGYLLYQKQYKPTSSAPQPTTQPSSSTSDETANWKTYTNTEYGYVIKYPLTAIQETKIVKDLPSQVYNTTHDYFKIEGGILEIYGVCGRGVQPIKQADITIGGQKATKLYETNVSGVITTISRPNSNESICFNFKLPNDPTKTQSVDALFNQILSTFKFLP